MFIGPPARAIEAMGSKTRARELMKKAGVPIVPGTTEPVETVEDAEKIAEEIGYPIAVKAAGGGGGKGFRVALEESKLKDAFEGAAREGEKFFSDATVYLERYLPDPRHVEVQVLADKHGNVIHLGERDCSIQRRHQKLIEESPAPLVDEELRERIGKIATDAAEAVGYHGRRHDRGPAPGRRVLLPRDEHARAGRALRDRGDDGHRHRPRADPRSRPARSCRSRRTTSGCAATRSSAASTPRTRRRTSPPRPGTVAHYREPSGPGVRVDSGVRGGLRDHAAVRPDGRQADRLGRRPRARHAAHAARAGGVRDRGRQDADPLPQGDHGLRAVGQGRDLPRPDRGQGVAEGARLRGRADRPTTRSPELEERTYTVEVVGQALRGRRPRRGRSPRAARRAANGAARRPAPQARRAQVRRRRRRRRHARLAAAGQHVEGARRGGRRRRRGRAHLHHRGDEDGERDHRPQGRQGRRARRQGGRPITTGDTHRRHQVGPSDRPRLRDPRAGRLAADPVGLHGGRQPRGAARGCRVGLAIYVAAGGTAELAEKTDIRRWWSASCPPPRRRAHGPDLRPLRRPGRRRRDPLDHARLRARHPRRPHLRPRCVRRQGQLPPAAAGGVRDGRRRRAARERPRAVEGEEEVPPTPPSAGWPPTSAAPTRRSSSTRGCSTPTPRR